MSDPLRLAYISQHDADDFHAWSGTVHGIAKAMRDAGALVSPIGPLRRPWTAGATSRGLMSRLRGTNTLRDRDPKLLRAWGRQASAALASLDVDCVLSPSTLPIAQLDTTLPIAVWVDATFAGMQAEYPPFARLDRVSARSGHDVEARALQRVGAAIFSSDWARDTALDAYDLDPANTHVVPYGAHVRTPPRELVDELIARRPPDRINLLFIAVLWESKGGDVALETARLLNEAGIPTSLTVIGVTPPIAGPVPEWLHCTGMLDKSTAEGRERFEREVGAAHVLLFPTRFDAYGLVIAEANAFGVPALAPNHGGPATIIRDGRNGMLLDRGADAAAYRDAVLDICTDRSSYERLARTSHQECVDRLGWPTAASRVMEILTRISS